MTKPITASAVVLLRDEGKLTLARPPTDPASRFVDAFFSRIQLPFKTGSGVELHRAKK
jgi:CubicO group peptidase (beta-lactamase class C family)